MRTTTQKSPRIDSHHPKGSKKWQQAPGKRADWSLSLFRDIVGGTNIIYHRSSTMDRVLAVVVFKYNGQSSRSCCGPLHAARRFLDLPQHMSRWVLCALTRYSIHRGWVDGCPPPPQIRSKHIVKTEKHVEKQILPRPQTPVSSRKADFENIGFAFAHTAQNM